MEIKFRLDASMVTSLAVMFALGFFLMSVPLITSGLFLELSIYIVTTVGLLSLFWVSFARGIYITIQGENLQVTRFFLHGKITPLRDVVSIYQRPLFGGLAAEVILKVRNEDGTFRKQGLINKPGLNESEYKRLFDTILSINPNIEIDPDLLSK